MDDKRPKTRRVNVDIDEELHLKARRKSVETGKPLTEVVREALRKWVEEDPPDEETAN